MEVCLWPRGDYIFEHLLPHCCALPDNDVVLQLLQELAPMRPGEIIDCDTWYSSCRYLEIPWESANAVYMNCQSASHEPRVSELCLDLFLLSFKPSKNSKHCRDELVAEFFHNNMTTILKILLLDPVSSVPDERLSALDYIFEGMIDSHPENASRIVRLMWFKEAEDGLRALSQRFSACQIPDPFRICKLRNGEPSSSYGLRKKTSLAPNGRRMVSISGWKRIQLLTKQVYRAAHLRLFNSLPTPSSVFALAYSLTITAENISDCPCLLLGPCSGTVLLKNIKNSTITTACRRILLENVENCTIFVSSMLSPIVWNCTEVKFAPFNTAYTGMWDELRSAGLNLPGLFKPQKEDSSWSILPASSFYIQPVPTICKDHDFQKLLSLFPENYSKVVQYSSRASTDEENGLRPSDIYYLKTKIEA